MATEEFATTDMMLAQQQACRMIEEDKLTIRQHLDRRFLDALKRMFGYDLPSIAYHRSADGVPTSGQDYHMVVLNGAVRDGQREVIATLEHIFNTIPNKQ